MDLRNALTTHRLLAIVRGTDPQAALRTVLVLAEGGLGLIEVSLTSAAALRVLAAARRELGPGAALGAGTVLTPDDAARAADAGASFLVTPALVTAALVTPALVDPGRAGPGPSTWPPGLPVLMGAFTPSEAAAAVQLGAAAVKLFPASMGGPGYLRALRDPFPATAFVPVGGVTLDAAPGYLAAGAVAVGAGSPLVADAASGGDLGQLRSRIAMWRAALAKGTD
jgi:2-dehydro-3-deoxyphosphogluconate aldolase/(4S)-4-hydroxy-2-oxoglutarate aldolase